MAKAAKKKAAKKKVAKKKDVVFHAQGRQYGEYQFRVRIVDPKYTPEEVVNLMFDGPSSRCNYRLTPGMCYLTPGQEEIKVQGKVVAVIEDAEPTDDWYEDIELAA